MDKSDYQIVIIANSIPTAPYYCWDAFCKSLDGETVTILGNDGSYKNLSDRPRILHKAFKDGIIKANNILFCDAWDLFFVDKIPTLFEKHNKNNADLTISAEKNCFPDDVKKEYDKLNIPTSYKYLNCGVIIGNSEAFYTCLESMDAPNHPFDYWMPNEQKMHHYNEQLHWAKEYLKQPVKIALDYTQDITWCLQDVKIDDVDFTGEKIKNIETGTTPSCLHMNGGSKTAGLREPILSHYKMPM